MAKIEIKVEDDELTGALQRITRSLSDMEPIMAQIGELMVQTTKDRFDVGRGPEGQIWAPRSPTTLQRYARKGFTPPATPLTGESKALRTQISYAAGTDYVEWGSSMIYSAVMQFGAAKGQFGKTKRGAAIPWGDVPARPYLGVSDEDRSDIVGMIEDWLEASAR